MKPWHIVVVLLVIIIIFGAAKLPDIARSLGQSAKVLKKEMRELQDDVPPGGYSAQGQSGQFPQQGQGPQGQFPPQGQPYGGQQYGQQFPPQNQYPQGYPAQQPQATDGQWQAGHNGTAPGWNGQQS